MIHFKNGLLAGTCMVDSNTGGSGAPTTTNTPAQPALSSTSGEVKDMGGTMRVVAGQDPKDVSNTGAVAADDGIDPATGKPKEAPKTEAAPASDKNPDGTEKTAEQAAADKLALENADKVPEGSKTGFTNKQIEEAKANATKTDARFVPYTEEFMVTGDLSPESKAKAAAAFNVSEGIVQQWLDGQKAQMQIGSAAQAIDQVARDKTVTSIKALAGSEAEYGAFQKWANANLPEAEMQTLVDAINTNNPGLYTMAMNNAVAKYKAAGNGGGPRDLTNKSTNAGDPGGVQGFASLAEQTAAINDPKYRTDDAYRKGVEQRIAISRF